MFPNWSAPSYRSGRNANELYFYGGRFAPTSNVVSITIQADHYFLCRKIHLIGFTSPNNAQLALDFQAKIIDTRLGRSFQGITNLQSPGNARIANASLGGNCGSPNILPCSILFEPSTVIQLDMDRTPTTVRWTLEGEKIYDPDPQWVEKMKSRFWFQYGVLLPTATPNQVTTLDLKDSRYDFAITRFISNVFADNIGSNANPGFVRIREKGPNSFAWSNDEVMESVFAGGFGFGQGAAPVQPPIIVPGTTQLEIITRAIATGGAYYDFVFDGIKFPRGTELEQWL